MDVGPVGHYHAVPAQLLLEPYREKLMVDVHRHAVDLRRIHHHGEGAALDSGLVGCEIFLTKINRTYDCGRTVFAGSGVAVSHIMLQAAGHVLRAEMVRVVTLIAFHHLHGHSAVDEGILAEALPYAAPDRIATQVHHGIVDPRDIAGASLIGCHGSSLAHKLAVERGRHVYLLREECAPQGVGGAMILVDAINVRHSYLLHRSLLDARYDAAPGLGSLCATHWHVEHRTHLIIANHGFHFCRVEFGATVHERVAEHLIDSHFTHLTDLLLESETRNYLLHLRFEIGIVGYSR